jgi:hypothetical protein
VTWRQPLVHLGQPRWCCWFGMGGIRRTCLGRVLMQQDTASYVLTQRPTVAREMPVSSAIR